MNAGVVVGVFVMIVSEAATLLRIEPFYSWNTPIAWTGFIVFADSVVWRARKRSWLHSSPLEFTFLALVSIPLWLVFEFYNLYIENWYYTGLPVNFWLRQFGYAWSFATIWPAIFEAVDLIDVWRAKVRLKPDPTTDPPAHPALPTLPAHPALPALPTLPALAALAALAAPTANHWLAALSIVGGAAMLLWPLLFPSRYLAAPVWLGFIFLLEPINSRLGEESLVDESGSAGSSRFKNLLLGGLLCGVLWEFWNYWAGAKWHYTVPIMEHFKIFEMPLPGYLGFPAFALECFTMYVFVRAITKRIFPKLTDQFQHSIGGADSLARPRSRR